MFKELKPNNYATDKEIVVRLNWDWIFEENGENPSCKVIIIDVPQSELLRAKAFSREEILNWFNKNVVDVSNRDTRIKNLEDYRKYCKKNTYEMENRDVGSAVHSFPKEEYKDKVFVVFVYSVHNFEMRVCSVVSEKDERIPFKLDNQKSGGFLGGIFGHKSEQLYLELENTNGRKGVLETTYNGETIYSLIPDGSGKYYFDAGVKKDDIKDVKNLATFLGD